MQLNSEQIQQIIPHRPPFLLVDRVLKLKAGRSAIAEKDVSGKEFFFQGHFPDEAIMPGVIIVEALAQTGAIILLSKSENAHKRVYFAGLKRVKFRRRVLPGDTLRLEAELIRVKGKFGTGEGKAFVNGELACEAEFMFSFA